MQQTTRQKRIKLEIKQNVMYKELFPVMTAKEMENLVASIRENGLRYPLVLNGKGVLVDGYNRLEACKRVGIKPKTRTVKFRTKEEELSFIFDSNRYRRHLNDFQLAEIGYKIYEIRAEEGKKRKKENLIQYKSKGSNEPVGNSSDIVAEEIGVSSPTFKRAVKIIKSDDEKLKEDVREGKTSINKGYRQIVNEEKREERIKKTTNKKITKNKDIELLNEDMTKTRLKAKSMELIFTDPPYTKDQIKIYDKLGKFSEMYLKDEGSLVCFMAQEYLLESIEFLERNGMKMMWVFAVISSGGSPLFYKKDIIQSWKPLVYFKKAKASNKNHTGLKIIDSVESKFEGKELHEWQQSTVESDYYIKTMTTKKGLVCDPFMGSGAFGVSAKKLGRRFIGIEIDKKNYEIARGNILGE